MYVRLLGDSRFEQLAEVAILKPDKDTTRSVG
jgi:hypothetical protein